MNRRKENNEMNTTRRKFLGMLGAATAMGSTTAFAFAGDTEFRELEPDKMYDFHNANGQKVLACPRSGREWSEALEYSLRQFDEWGELERVFGEQSKRESRFISQDGGKDVAVTGAWLREFWRRHNGG